MDSLKLIEELSNAYGGCGFEDEVLTIARKYAAGLADISEDSIRNLYLNSKTNTGKKPVVMLDAHSDEVSFMVQAIKPDGTLLFVPFGGWVDNTVPAHKVKIRNFEGEYISGVVATTPPHFLSMAQREKSCPISDMVIDVGATSKQEVEEIFHIHVGAIIVPDVTFEYNEKNHVMLGKAFDNRLGCAAVLESLEQLQGENLAVDVVGALASQEEIGERGAHVTPNVVKPDLAICFEGCPADDTFAPEYLIQTAMKRGPMLRHIDKLMISNPRFMRFALDMGKKHDIPVQEAVRAGGCTNGAPIHVSGGSVPVIVIGVPVRYIHTHHGFACIEDYQYGVRLAVEIVKAMNGDIIKSF